MKNYKEELESLRQELNSRIDAEIAKVEKPKTVSGWYKSDAHNKWLAYYDFENNLIYGFGFSDGAWFSRKLERMRVDSGDYLAPPKEVEEALTKEFNKLYPKGSKVKCLTDGATRVIDNGSFWYIFGDNYAYHHGAKVFDNGIWAEPIKTMTIDELASKLIGLDLEDTKSEIVNRLRLRIY